jgi:putative membrane protein
MWWNSPAPWFGMMFWPLIMIALIVICMFVMMRMMGGSRMRMPPWRGRDDDAGPSSRAVEILNERYARGEIDRQEYEERKRVLSERLVHRTASN